MYSLALRSVLPAARGGVVSNQVFEVPPAEDSALGIGASDGALDAGWQDDSGEDFGDPTDVQAPRAGAAGLAAKAVQSVRSLAKELLAEAGRPSPLASAKERPREEQLPEPEPQPAKAALGSPFIVDNSHLRVRAPGLAYRFSKRLEDRDDFGAVAQWGSTVVGIDTGDGWLKVGGHYLPMTVQGVPVLSPLADVSREAADPWGAMQAARDDQRNAEERQERLTLERQRVQQEAARRQRESEAQQLREAEEEARRRDSVEWQRESEKIERSIHSDEERARRKEAVRQVSEQERTVLDHYGVLGVARHATPEEITHAYRGLARLHHPDKTAELHPAERRMRERQMAAINSAHRVLGSPRQRRDYDRDLGPDPAEAAVAAAEAAAAAMLPRDRQQLDPDPSADADFDFTGDGRPYRFARGKASRVAKACGSRDLVRLAMEQLRGKEPMELRDRNGMVRHVGPLSPFGGLGECGDPVCGAHRLDRAEVRDRFRDFVVGRVRDAVKSRAVWWSEGGLRIASLGSGELLFEVELLERLRYLGVRIEQICLVDWEYRQPRVDTRRALREFADWQRAAAIMCKHEPAELLAFGMLEDYHEAVREDGLAAGCHLMLHCDANWDGAIEDCDRLAKRALVDGGLLVRLAAEPEQQALRRTGARGPFAADCLEHSADMPHSCAPFATGAWTLRTGLLPALEPLEDPRLTACGVALAAAQATAPSLEVLLERSEAQAKARTWARAQAQPEPTPQAKQAGPAGAAEEDEPRPRPRTRPRPQVEAVVPAGQVVALPQPAPAPPKPSKARMRQMALEQGLSVWRVICSPHVAVRAKPKVTAKTVALILTGQEVFVPAEMQGEWLRVSQSPDHDLPEEAWVLSDASDIGLGPLLERVATARRS